MGSSGHGGINASTGMKNAKNEATENAADLNATHIVFTSVTGGWGPDANAEAYDCSRVSVNDTKDEMKEERKKSRKVNKSVLQMAKKCQKAGGVWVEDKCQIILEEPDEEPEKSKSKEMVGSEKKCLDKDGDWFDGKCYMD